MRYNVHRVYERTLQAFKISRWYLDMILGKADSTLQLIKGKAPLMSKDEKSSIARRRVQHLRKLDDFNRYVIPFLFLLLYICSTLCMYNNHHSHLNEVLHLIIQCCSHPYVL